jgi:diguanylate cyclase (GGDEF)-like protein/PAS domain S-box-containing protein
VKSKTGKAPSASLTELETYRRVFYSSPDFISISRYSDGFYIDVNPGFERFTGLRRDDVIGKTSLELGIWEDPADRIILINALHSTGEVHDFETQLRNREGAVRNVALSASIARTATSECIDNPDGDKVLVVVVRDITDRLHDEAELRQHREHLEMLVQYRTAKLHQTNDQLVETNRRLKKAHEQLLQTEKRIRHMALHDSLTSLPNRALLQDRVTQAIVQADRARQSMAVMFVDLDNFKHINDSLGHIVGDHLLCEVSQRLKQCVRKSDTVARLGGDEFVICLTGLESGDQAAALAQKVLAALEQPLLIDAIDLHTSGSIGIGIYPDDGNSVEALMRAADTAMYHAKSKGRGNFQFFTPALDHAAQQRMSIESRLRMALPKGELRLHYQPQVDIATGRIVSVEALLRWRHPGRGFVPPLEFIPIAEECGMITRIGEWVLEEACAQLRRWRDAGHSDLCIAVNLSARQMLQPDFAGQVQGILNNAGLPADALDLEITESVLMQPGEESTATLKRLFDMGVQLSVDDFGTGYSSLAYLKRFPIHALKIDRSFVSGIGQDPSDAAIVSTIIVMARNLRLKVIAEGVETAEQAAFLAENDCALAQGYYYSRPIEADALGILLQEGLVDKVA